MTTPCYPTPLHHFLAVECRHIPGSTVRTTTFQERFDRWLDPALRPLWKKGLVDSLMPSQFPKGRRVTDNHWCFGNLAFSDSVPSAELALDGETLRPAASSKPRRRRSFAERNRGY